MTRSRSCRTGTFVLAAIFSASTGCGNDFRGDDATAAGGSGGTGAGGDPHTASTSGSGGAASGAGGATATSSSGATTTTTTSSAGAGGGAVAVPTTLLVVDQHDAPRAGIDIVVNDATGAVVANGVTGAAGDALVTVPEGGSVSVFYSIELTFYVDSVLDVPAGGFVRFSTQAPEPAPPPPPASTTYKIVAQGQPAGTASLMFLATCDASSTSGTSAIMDNAGCAADATQDFLVLALASDQTPLAWGALLDQPTSPGALLDFAVQVNQTTFTAMDAQLVNVPSMASYGFVSVKPSGREIGVWTTAPTFTPFPSFGASVSVPAGVTPSYEVAEYADWSFGESSQGWVSRRRDYDVLPAVSTFDAGPIALVSVQPADLSDPAHPKLGWTHGNGALGDLGELTAYWTSGASSTSYEARFAPDHPSPIRIPDIPAALAAYAPSIQTTFAFTLVTYADEETESTYEGVLDGVTTVSGLGTVRSSGLTYQP